MKTFITILLSSFLSILFIQCSSDDNDSYPINNQSQFKGNWSGSYTGMSEGTWSASIDENGVFSGKTKPTQGLSIFFIEGEVNDNGILNAQFYFNNTVVGQFSGNLIQTEGQGQWTNTILNLTGSWKGSKQ